MAGQWWRASATTARRKSGAGYSGASSSFGYDAASRLSSLGHDFSGTGADQSQTFAYNAASQIVSRTGSDAYAWTAAVNVSRSYSVNGLNQYTAAGPAALGYDLNGNLSSSPDMVGGTSGTTSYTYDAENRLVAASGLRTASLSYDPLGRLFQTSGGSAGTTQFLYDGDELVAEYDGGGNLLRRYVHGTGVDDPVVWYQGSGLGDRRSLFADHQGSIVAVANGSGTMLQINAYDPWGVPGGEITSRFAYTGQAWLPELGMYHYKARIYSPTLGRFLQTDPIGYEGGINLYGYAADDPVNLIDPSGHVPIAIPVGMGIRCLANAACRAAIANGARAVGRKVADIARPILLNQNNAENANTAKARREKQQAMERARRAQKSGGEPEDGQGSPKDPQAQNKQFKDVAKQLGLSKSQQDRLHKEITKRNLDPKQIKQVAEDMFQGKVK